MFTNIDTKRNLKKIYHCHKLLRDCSRTTSFERIEQMLIALRDQNVVIMYITRKTES